METLKIKMPVEELDGLVREAGEKGISPWEFNAKTINKASMMDLASWEFIKRRDNLTWVGQSGMGKSHLIQGIGRACCVLGYRVRYETSATLLEELMRAAGSRPHS